MKKRALLKTLAATLAVAGIGIGAAQAQDVTKVGFVYVGPIGDHGWTYRHDIGRQAVEEAFGDQVETSYVESVKEGPDAERVIRQLAASGHDLIFTTSFGFMNPTIKVIAFLGLTGFGTNVGGWTALTLEIRPSSRALSMRACSRLSE